MFCYEKPQMAELELIDAVKTKELFLAQRPDEVSGKTLQVYHYRLNPFVRWYDSEGREESCFA